jgi:predicted DCC family thiol-disulfide oxidoreductase YuxK
VRADRQPTERLLVFDGDCGFCTRSARWIEVRLPDDVDVVPWQSIDDLGSLGLTARGVTEEAWWVDRRGAAGGHRAVGRALQAAGRWWRPLGWVVRNPPGSWLAGPAYRLLATNRHRLPGSTEACRIDAGPPG